MHVDPDTLERNYQRVVRNRAVTADKGPAPSGQQFYQGATDPAVRARAIASGMIRPGAPMPDHWRATHNLDGRPVLLCDRLAYEAVADELVNDLPSTARRLVAEPYIRPELRAALRRRLAQPSRAA